MDDRAEGALEAGECVEDEPELRVTLHVDLAWTDLADFRERIESELGTPIRYWRFAVREHWLFGGESFAICGAARTSSRSRARPASSYTRT